MLKTISVLVIPRGTRTLESGWGSGLWGKGKVILKCYPAPDSPREFPRVGARVITRKEFSTTGGILYAITIIPMMGDVACARRNV